MVPNEDVTHWIKFLKYMEMMLSTIFKQMRNICRNESG